MDHVGPGLYLKQRLVSRESRRISLLHLFANGACIELRDTFNNPKVSVGEGLNVPAIGVYILTQMTVGMCQFVEDDNHC
ncbi:MAG: hypothetical protein ABSG13_30500 [Bryobacteraceae bacterium]|jgi:hypothetical protein